GGRLCGGGTSGAGLGLAAAYAARGEGVVLPGRDADRAPAAATRIGANGRALDLCEPNEIAARLDGVGPARRLVLAAIERDENAVHDYDVSRALRLITLKLVGYTEVVHVLVERLTDDASILVCRGRA